MKAEKNGVGMDEARAAVRLGNFTSLNFALSNKARVSDEQAAKNASIKKFFDDGVAAANAGNHQGAVDAFTQAATAMPTCSDCYYNIGVSQSQMKNTTRRRQPTRRPSSFARRIPEAYNAGGAVHHPEENGSRRSGVNEGSGVELGGAWWRQRRLDVQRGRRLGTRTSSPKRSRRSKVR